MDPAKLFSLSASRVKRTALLLVIITLPLFSARAKAESTPEYRLTVDTIAQGLVHPWGLAFLPDGTMLVTERRGTLQWIDASGRKTLVDNVPTSLLAAKGDC